MTVACKALNDLGIKIESFNLISDDFDYLNLSGSHTHKIIISVCGKTIETEYTNGVAYRSYPKMLLDWHRLSSKERALGYGQGKPIVWQTQGRRRSLFLASFDKQTIPDNPILSDVLYCLLSDADFGDQSFNDYCDNLGADNDSISTKAIWEACRDLHYQVRPLFDSDLRKKVDEILENY